MKKRDLQKRIAHGIDRGHFVRLSPADLIDLFDCLNRLPENEAALHRALVSLRTRRFSEAVALASGIVVGAGAVVLGILLGAW